MKSLLNSRRLQGALVALVVALVAGATGATTATAGPVASSEGATASSVAKTSALTAKQRKAKKRALKKCRKNRKAKKRRACIKRTNKKFNRLARRNKNKPAKGKTVVVDVRDDYYTPNQVNVKVNDSIKWDWRYSVGSEGHNVTLTNARQLGISPFEFESPIQTGPSYTFTRKFTKPGDYRFACTLHTLMTMDVKVSR